MIIRNSVAMTGAAFAGVLPPVLLVGGAMCLSPFSGAAAFTSVLSLMGGSLMGGLLGLLVLSTLLAIATYIFLQLQLAWLPV